MDMKHTIRFFILFFALVMAGAGKAWAISESDIIINVQPDKKAGTVTVTSISGMTVTISAEPATGYNIDANHIMAEKMVDALAPRRGSGMADKLDITDNGSNSFSFTIPEGYTGAYVTVNFYKDAPEGFTQITSLSEITDMNGSYQLTTDVSGVSTSLGEFKGTLDGGLHKIIGSSAPLFTSTDGAIIRNIIFEDANISSGDSDGDAGAVTSKATGNTRIYNCGINPSSAERNQDGEITGFFGSSVSGSRYVGGLVGFLDGSARVINCYSYANISGGTHHGGIVGYNNVATTSANLKTMVMNCMFYGNITGGSIAPIYNGTIITNDGDANGVNNFNYFWAGASYVKNKTINEYNCALSAETRFLQRFEFFRHLLNSNRELAAWWVKGTDGQKSDMAKWVVEPSQIGSNIPFPILKVPGYYPSVVNYTPSTTAYDETNRNKGYKLTNEGDGGVLHVTISMGSGGAQFNAPSGAGLKTGETGKFDLSITDKDTLHYNFNYGKVQLPYYNDYCDGNYTENRVVTGWKIISMNKSAGSFTTGADASATVNADGDITLTTPYNFADRKKTAKDIYSDNNKRVFSQGAYFDVPEGVTSITIEPYWAKAVYLSDENWDVVYKNGTGNKPNEAGYKDDAMTSTLKVPNVGGGQRYKNGNKYDLATHSLDETDGQIVYTSMSNAISSTNETGLYVDIEGDPNDHTVYDYAVVLVGNYHQIGSIEASNSKPYTVTSIDLDGDNEPDYSFMLRFNGRTAFHPVRYDFLNLIGLGMAQKTTGGKGSYNLGIMQPKAWFEVTNTALLRVTQFEYDRSDRSAAPHILQGGVFEQWVSGQNNGISNKTIYFHVGGNVWFKEFHLGTHIDKTHSSKHPPISVTGGDFNEFYLTGLYRGDITSFDDNAECYINGGRFGILAGAGQEGLGNATKHTNGNITWQIDNADIKEFYGGGFNQPIQGNITTVISNSLVDQFCGGPKFGDMWTGRTVKTKATNCTFGTYFGAGYGGNAYSREAPSNVNYIVGDYTGWDSWVNEKYTQEYSTTYKGVSTKYDYQSLPMSNNTQNVARIFIDYVRFSLAKTRDVTSKLTDCHITGNFYGGGSLGKVDGPVSSTLNNCTVDGSVFGAGYSASTPKVDVVNTGDFTTAPFYDENLGAFFEPEFPSSIPYTWANRNETINSTELAIDKTNHILYTNEDLNTLGTVTGNVTLTINGNTVADKNGKVMTVGESVYGGGEESGVDGNTEVKVTGGTIGTKKEDGTVLGGAEYGNVYGGGKGKEDNETAGLVKGNTNVIIQNTTEGETTIIPTIYHNVYGGGAYGSVGTFTYNATTGLPETWNTENDKGKCTVTITGGTIGTTGKENGMVFGSSRGDVGQPGGITDKQAWVHQTQVTIGDAALETGPTIKGSVYGGGENGHTFTDAVVNIVKGTIGITDSEDPDGGARYPYRGNVYGGGCGTDTYTVKEDAGTENEKTKTYFNRLAGIVEGNTTVNITDGHVVHNVYGGGAMGSVGVFTRDASDNIHVPGKITGVTSGGKCTVTVSGGIVGNTGAQMTAEGGPDDFGHVFGAGRGEVHDTLDYPNLQRVVYVDNTDVTISGGLVTGSVYGGSESGHVLGNTVVKIQGGQIGCGVEKTSAYTDTDWSATSLNPTAHWSYTANGKPYDQYAGETEYDSKGAATTATDGHTFYGNVFGGGSGYYPYAPGKWLRSAGYVGGTATVKIEGGHILNNVYGGCEMADIEGAVTVEMTGGTVGVPRSKSDIEALPTLGHIYGAGMGDKRIFFNTSTNVASTTVSVTGGTVYGSVYGGGEDGHVLGNATTTISQAANKTTVIGCDGKSGWDGNVFGGGQGSVTAKTAGVVAGDVVVNIEGGTMKGSVYGGGRLASVGTYFAMVDHANYGKMQADAVDDPATTEVNEAESHGHIKVNLNGGTIHQNVYGGSMGTTDAGDESEDYGVSKTVEVNLNKTQCEGKDAGSIGTASGCAVKGDIFGCNNTNASPQQDVTIHVYGTQNAAKNDIATKFFKATANLDDIATLSSLKASVAGLNSSTETPTEKEAQYNAQKAIYDNENSTAAQKKDALAEMKAIVLLAVADELEINTDAYTNSSNENKQTALDDIKKAINESKYDVHAVYGGGNLAAYKPIGPNPTTTSDDGKNTTYSTNVIIDGCGLTSIRYAYGGGNAASTPATSLTVNGTYEIEEVFGGGNGKDAIGKDAQGNDIPNPGANVGFYDYSDVEGTYPTKEARQGTEFVNKYTYGSGKASVNIYGGTIHRVFGGSNTKGNVRITAVTMLEEAGGCDFCVDEAYGGGKSAPMDAEAKLLMACIPGLKVAYGGAEAADVQGDVTLNITNGTFDRVFGGNNKSGTISGSITVNISEVGCKPIIIGELYGGGNLAGYSVYGYNSDKSLKEKGTQLYSNPQVNVKSFTSIGTIYGGGYGAGATMVGNPTVNIDVVNGAYYNDDKSVIGDDAKTPNDYPIPSHAKGKIGAINNVFGGGNAAMVKGDTHVNIGTSEVVYEVANPAPIADNFASGTYYVLSGEGTPTNPYEYVAAGNTFDADKTYYVEKPVVGVDIRGNVYGGGNNAEVTGDTNVTIGKKAATTSGSSQNP